MLRDPQNSQTFLLDSLLLQESTTILSFSATSWLSLTFSYSRELTRPLLQLLLSLLQ